MEGFKTVLQSKDRKTINAWKKKMGFIKTITLSEGYRKKVMSDLEVIKTFYTNPFNGLSEYHITKLFTSVDGMKKYLEDYKSIDEMKTHIIQTIDMNRIVQTRYLDTLEPHILKTLYKHLINMS